MPSWDLYSLNALLVFAAEPDPEDTLQMAITRQEFAVMLWATLVLGRLFPETQNATLALYRKLTELSEAQDWLDITPEIKKTMGMDEDEQLPLDGLS